MNEKGLAFTSKFLFLNNDPAVKNRMPMLLYFSILNRCATVDEAKALLESLPKCGVGTAVFIGDSEKFLRMEANIMDREIEVVRDGVRWNANNPRSRTMVPYSMIEEMDEATTLFSGNRNKRLEHLAENTVESSIQTRCLRLSAITATQTMKPTCAVCVCILNTLQASKRVLLSLRCPGKSDFAFMKPIPA